MKKTNTVIHYVQEPFDLSALTNRLANIYRAKNHIVHVFPSADGQELVFIPDRNRFRTRFGLEIGISAHFTLRGHELQITCTDTEQTNRGECFIFGWFLLGVPVITALIGKHRQQSLERQFCQDIQRMVLTMQCPH